MSDSLIHLAPSFDEPLEMLDACHGRVRAQLDTLRRLLPHLARHGADEQARQAAGAILRYFDNAAPNHHNDEEVDLLPALEVRAQPESRARVAAVRERVLSDHARMYALWAALRPQLAAIQLGQCAVVDEAVAAEFDKLYRCHIEFEESEVLPLARELLDRDALMTLGAAMTARRTASAATNLSTGPVD